MLDRVLRKRESLDFLLSVDSSLARLSRRDRAFARHLVATTLRRLGQIDALIDHCLERPLKEKLSGLRDLLRLGTCQLAILDTPAHAAVSTSVALSSGTSGGRNLATYRGLVNAVLRRLAREAPTLMAGQDAARLCTPDWLWQAWSRDHGGEAAAAIAAAHLAEPPLDLTVKEAPEAWAERLGATLLPTGSLRLPPGSGDVAALPGYAAGAWWVQDAAAALPARLLGDVAGKRVIDLCAAPGGKTAQLAAAGAAVTAVDRAPKRLKSLTENLARLDLAAAAVTADATTWQAAEPADAILLDAPCSGTGTLRRHPDIAHLKAPGQIAALTELQDRLLDSALANLRPGGVLVYATCSLQSEEGPQRIAALLGRAPGAVERRPIAPAEVGGLADLITAEGDLRSLPFHLAEAGGLDGFFACRLRRI